MGVSVLLNKLQGVKRVAADKWVACCPAHADKNPSLAIRALDDGRILLKCFAGCDVDEVVGAMGLELSDLFPPRLTSHHHPKERRPFTGDDALRAIDFEASVVYLAACDLARGKTLSEADRARLGIAAQRINEAMGAVWVN